MTYSIQIEKDALAQLKKIDQVYQKLIIKNIDKLKIDPFIGKQLKGNWASLRRIRVSNYRVIYSIKNNELIVLILRIGHRKNVY